MKVTLRNNIDNMTANQDPVDKDCRLVCLKLPFYNDKMEDFKRKLVKLVRKYYPNVKLNVVFSSPTTIGSFFPFKDKCPASLRSNVVYKLWCEGCDESYIGITQRCIARRMKEHQSKKDSHVFQHLQKCEGPVDFERVEILDTASAVISNYIVERNGLYSEIKTKNQCTEAICTIHLNHRQQLVQNKIKNQNSIFC